MYIDLYHYVLFIVLYSDLELTTADVIKQQKAKFLYEDDHIAHRITVRCNHILEDAFVAIRSSFDEKKHIRVRFIGEPAIDEGGPRREFFMLLMGAVGNSSSLLDGPPNRRVIRHNTSAFQVC